MFNGVGVKIGRHSMILMNVSTVVQYEPRSDSVSKVSKNKRVAIKKAKRIFARVLLYRCPKQPNVANNLPTIKRFNSTLDEKVYPTLHIYLDFCHDLRPTESSWGR